MRVFYREVQEFNDIYLIRLHHQHNNAFFHGGILNQTRKCSKCLFCLLLAGNAEHVQQASSSKCKTCQVSFPCFQADFQRLALGFKCDMFTLEKRLRLEERSRDLAEENVRKEISSCQGLLQVRMQKCAICQLSVDEALVLLQHLTK